MADTLAAALAAFQAELPKFGKDKTAKAGQYSYSYADLATCSEAILPALGKHGLSFSARPTLNEQGVFVLAYTLRHAGGESVDGAYPLPGANTPAQQLGSAITYARRYALLAVTGVAAGDDDDGASAPPASAKPAERHEASWDAAEQESLRNDWGVEIAMATGDELTAISKKIAAQKRAGEMSPATFDHLVKAGAARRAELEAAKSES